MIASDPDVIRGEIERTKTRIAGELALLRAKEERARQLGGTLVMIGAALVAVVALVAAVRRQRR